MLIEEGWGFMLGEESIQPTVEEAWDGVIAMAQEIYPEYQTTNEI